MLKRSRRPVSLLAVRGVAGRLFGGLATRLIALAAMLLTGASVRADDGDDVIRFLASQDAAVLTVGERLSIAARPLCAPGGWALGALVQTRSQYGAAYRGAATRLLGLADYPTITFVRPDSAAAGAGLVAGDQIVAVDSHAMPHTPVVRGAAQMADVERALDALDRGFADGSADLRIKRGDAFVTVPVKPTPACRVRFDVRAGDNGSANATSDRVQVSSDLVDPARAGSDLAALIAHELAHVILGHEQKLRGKWGGLLPGFGRNGPALRASELAADRLSIYLLARAGYRPTDAIPYWTALARRSNYGIFSDRTHPDWSTRIAAMKAEVTRLEAASPDIDPPADLLVPPG